MLGNLRGWIISLAIAAFFGLVIYTQGRPGTVSPGARTPRGYTLGPMARRGAVSEPVPMDDPSP